MDQVYVKLRNFNSDYYYLFKKNILNILIILSKLVLL